MTRTRWLVILVAVALLALWRTGVFDHALVNGGLNAKPCAVVSTGATLCGNALEVFKREQPTEYSQRLQRSREVQKAEAVEAAAREERAAMMRAAQSELQRSYEADPEG